MHDPNQRIYVTRPALPPLEEYVKYLGQIWESRFVTNNGPFHRQFEQKLAEYLGVKYISVFANGTLALITALQALKITGEVITTPFSFVATTHALWWNNIKPVFADIEPETFGLDPQSVESAITPQTTAILPVHIYGYPCQVERLQEISDRHHLKLIYDAAHAFGVKKGGHSILNFGDLSVMSFHATKAFNTIEGGAIVCHDQETKDRVDHLKNFGFVDETIIIEPGINAKMNELQAAYGLLQLKYIDRWIAKRKAVAERYRELLGGVPGIRTLSDIDGVRHNYPYFPILIDADTYGKTRDDVYHELREQNIFTRRYFYPLISQIPMYRSLPSARPENLPIAERVAGQILCLPMYHDLPEEVIVAICQYLSNTAS